MNPHGEIYGGAERNFHCVPVGETFPDKVVGVQLSSAVLYFSMTVAV